MIENTCILADGYENLHVILWLLQKEHGAGHVSHRASGQAWPKE
jgi:hypothetical protein